MPHIQHSSALNRQLAATEILYRAEAMTATLENLPAFLILYELRREQKRWSLSTAVGDACVALMVCSMFFAAAITVAPSNRPASPPSPPHG